MPKRQHPFDAEIYRCFPSFPVSFTGQSLISHAGGTVLTGFMNALGFGRLCEDRLAQSIPSGARHRSGKLLGSLAAMLAAGGEHASDLDILRSSPRGLCSVALERENLPVL
ncbi:transposase [Arthrobacter sp. SO5]|uniref:transposase n=1 Tax=Arthrobacter sp. SO5 TaxID=1897055 RepID=UPI001E2E617C|nr:transposase [Arthrobacter sp. SO5]